MQSLKDVLVPGKSMKTITLDFEACSLKSSTLISRWKIKLALPLLALLMAFVEPNAARAANQTKANNNTALQTGSSWTSGTAPGSTGNAIWNGTVTTAADCTNTLGATVTWGGIIISNPAAPVSINGSTTLTLNNGISLASATENLILNCGTISVASNKT